MIGIARVVLHTKEHLAALVPSGAALVLNTLRWSNDLRDPAALNLPAEGMKAANLKDAEMKMAEQLIGDMTVPFDPGGYTDRFADAVHKLVEQRVAAGKTEKVEPLEAVDSGSPSNVIDLTELLKRSLGARKGGNAKASNDDEAGDGDDSGAEADAKPAAKKAARKSAHKTAHKSAAKSARRAA